MVDKYLYDPFLRIYDSHTITSYRTPDHIHVTLHVRNYPDLHPQQHVYDSSCQY